MTKLLPFTAFSYSSYKEFLQDAYDFCHEKQESYSFDLIASACQLKSRTHARNIIKGIQKPRPDQLEKLCEFFLLSEAETKYILCLAKFMDIKSCPMAYELFEQLMVLQKAENPEMPNPFKDIEVMTSVLHMTVLSAFELNSYLSAADLKPMLKNKFTENEILGAISDLESLKYIETDPSTLGKKLLQKHIRKYDFNSNFFLKKFHNECLDLAKRSLNEEDTSERYLIGASFNINHKVFPRMIQKINAFVENLMQLENVAGPSDTVVQLNTQLIKMSQFTDTEKKRVLGLSETERVLSN